MVIITYVDREYFEKLYNFNFQDAPVLQAVFKINGDLTPTKVGSQRRQPHFRLVVIRRHPCIYVFHQVLNWMTPKKNGGQSEIVTWLSIGHHFFLFLTPTTGMCKLYRLILYGPCSP